MKKIIIMLLLLLIVFCASCTTIEQYLPYGDNDNSSVTGAVVDEHFEDSDSFIIELNENVSLNESNKTVEVEAITDEEVIETTQQDEALFSISVVEGDTVALNLEATDPDGDNIEYTYSEPFDKKGIWKTEDGDAGKYMATVKASDGLLTTTETILVIVTPSNKAPVIECPSEFNVQEGELVDLPCTLYDPEGEKVTYKVQGFMDDLTYQTTYADNGVHKILIIANDGIKTSQKEIVITVVDKNRLPEVNLLTKSIKVTEGETAKINVEANDADGNDVSIEFAEPFNNNGIWETKKGDSGNYNIDIVVSDGQDMVTVTANVEVKKFNEKPTIVGPNELTVAEGDLINLPIEVTDVNNDDITISVSGFMNGMSYQTTYEDAGEYEVTVTASDGKNVAKKTMIIVVENSNRPPQFVLHQ